MLALAVTPTIAEQPGASRTVVSLQLASFLASGLDVQLERYLADNRWSLALSLGLRPQARGDFHGVQVSAGFETRRFVWGPILATLDGKALGGLFAFTRLDGSWNRLFSTDNDRHLVGQGYRLSPALGLGYRFLPAMRLELTPSVGAGIDAQLDGTAAGVRIRPSITFGLTVGWVV